MKPSAGWTTYGTSRAVFSSFQGVVTDDMNDSSEDSYVVTTLVVTSRLKSSLHTNSHVLNNRVPKFTGLELRRAFHLPLQIVGDSLLFNRLDHATDDQLGRLAPAQMLEHHHTGQDHRSWIDDIQISVFRRGSVRGFKNRCVIADICPGCQTKSPHLRRACIRQVIAVQIRRGDD